MTASHPGNDLMRSSRLSLLAASLAAAVLAGCENSNTYKSEGSARPNQLEFESRVSNPFLAGKVDVTSAFAAESDGLLRVQANIRNQTNGNARFMYRWTWFDGQGMKVTANSDFWTRREANGGGEIEIVGMAPKSACRDWRLEIRPWDS
jgi:uncharacterized protein YcfL